MNRKQTLLGIIFITFASTHAVAQYAVNGAQQAGDFTVISEPGAKLTANDAIDRVPPEREVELLHAQISRIYPRLPENLKPIADQITFVVNHSQAGLTKKYMGWSAEDDSYYKFPDTEFFHPTENPQGTIRANFTEKYIKVLEFVDDLIRNRSEIERTIPAAADSAWVKGAQSFGDWVIVHELTHALQYHRAPVRDIANYPQLIKAGLLDRELLYKDSEKKIQYEHQALAAHRKYMDSSSLVAFANVVEAYEKANPSLFNEQGKYRLLSSTKPNAFVSYYLREQAANVQLGEQFGPQGDITYYGQIVPPKLAWEMYNLRRGLEKQLGKVLTSRDQDNEKRAQIASSASLALSRIEQQWDKYLGDPRNSYLKSSFEYLASVQTRYEQDRKSVTEIIGGNPAKVQVPSPPVAVHRTERIVLASNREVGGQGISKYVTSPRFLEFLGGSEDAVRRKLKENASHGNLFTYLFNYYDNVYRILGGHPLLNFDGAIPTDRVEGRFHGYEALIIKGEDKNDLTSKAFLLKTALEKNPVSLVLDVTNEPVMDVHGQAADPTRVDTYPAHMIAAVEFIY